MKLPKTTFEQKRYYWKAKLTLKWNNFKWKWNRRLEIWNQKREDKNSLIVKWVPKPYHFSKYEDERQSRCYHLKGGQHRRAMIRDYAITDHQFIDGTRKVWCQLCKKTWVPGTWGWKRDVPFMLANTTNTCTSSEIPLGAVKEGTLRGYPLGNRSGSNRPEYAKYKTVIGEKKDLDRVWKNRLNVLFRAIKIRTQGE